MNKYCYLYVLQGDYGYGDGWEDLTAEESWMEIKERRKEYRDNDVYVHRLRVIHRREPNPEYKAA